MLEDVRVPLSVEFPFDSLRDAVSKGVFGGLYQHPDFFFFVVRPKNDLSGSVLFHLWVAGKWVCSRARGLGLAPSSPARALVANVLDRNPEVGLEEGPLAFGVSLFSSVFFFFFLDPFSGL